MRVLTATRAPIWLACTASCALLALALVPHAPPKSGRYELAASAITLAQRMSLEVGLARFDAALSVLDLKIALALADRPRGCPSRRERSRAEAQLRELKRQQAELQRTIEQQRREQRVAISAACLDNAREGVHVKLGRPPRFLVAACGLMWILCVLLVVRTRDEPSAPSRPVSPHDAEQVLAISHTVESQAMRAKLAQQLAAFLATLDAIERSDPGCPDCGGSAIDDPKRELELRLEQAEVLRRAEQARIDELRGRLDAARTEVRRPPGVRISKACLDNPLAKGCW